MKCSKGLVFSGISFFMLSLPAYAQDQGFFLDDWQPKTIAIAEYNDVAKPPAAPGITVTVNLGDTITKVSKYLFGNNSNLWMGQLVTEANLLEHLTNLKPNLVRAPGGSISDIYFWNAQADQPPADAPDSLMDANGTKTKAGFWYGKNAASWTLSIDNYYSMLQQTGNKGIISVNYAYARYGRSSNPVAAAAHLAADWVRYDHGRTRFWEIGNENGGSWEAGYRIDLAKNLDGQPEFISGSLYGQHFKIFADSMRAAAAETGATIYIGAQLVEHAPESWEGAITQTWNSGVIAQVNNTADFYIVHNYYTPFNTNSNASTILATATSVTQGMMSYVKQNILANSGMLKPIALTEFNIFAIGSRQQVSHINGMHAAITVSELIKNKYGQASRWDLANGWANGDDHGMFNQGDEPGGIPKWNPRPDFYHLYFLQKFCGDHLIGSSVAGSSDILSYATAFSSGQLGLALFNKGSSNHTVKINFQDFAPGNRYYWYTLNGSNDNGEFSGQVIINGNPPTNASGGPLNYASLKPNSAAADNDIKLTLPPRSAVHLLVERNNGPTATNDIDPAGKKIQVLNNPSDDGSFMLKMNGFSGTDRFDMNIFDATGKVVYTTRFAYSAIVPFNLYFSSGLYHIKLQTKQGTTTRKLVIY